MKPDPKTKRRAILLVKDMQRFSEALRMGQTLLNAGASVALACLGIAGLEPEKSEGFKENSTLTGLSKAKLSIMCWYAGHFPISENDFTTISLDRLAEKLRTADLIVPF